MCLKRTKSWSNAEEVQGDWRLLAHTDALAHILDNLIMCRRTEHTCRRMQTYILFLGFLLSSTSVTTFPNFLPLVYPPSQSSSMPLPSWRLLLPTTILTLSVFSYSSCSLWVRLLRTTVVSEMQIPLQPVHGSYATRGLHLSSYTHLPSKARQLLTQ